MEIPIYDFLKAVNEGNKASEMALCHAVSVLSDLKNLTPPGRTIMVESLIEIIADQTDDDRY